MLAADAMPPPEISGSPPIHRGSRLPNYAKTGYPATGSAPPRLRDERGRAMDFKQHIRAVPDFPQPGILFYDISTLLAHGEAWRAMVDQLTDAVRGYRPDVLVGIESRGFLVAAPLAYALGCGFAMVRKKGKLPGPTARYTYDLEYGSDTIELQADAIGAGQRVVVLDDLIATGGTLQAAIELVRRQGGIVAGAACVIELSFLGGRGKIGVPLTAMIAYES
jgi:adenine phosphoribosyltransferase